MSGSGEKSNERAYLSIIAALYMRIPEVGSVMTCPVLRLISQLMSLEPISRALDPRCLVTKREAMTMSARFSLKRFCHGWNELRHMLSVGIKLHGGIVAMIFGISHTGAESR